MEKKVYTVVRVVKVKEFYLIEAESEAEALQIRDQGLHPDYTVETELKREVSE